MISEVEIGIVLFGGRIVNVNVIGFGCYGFWQGARAGDALPFCKEKIEVEQ